jgi:general secretion pathway protein J
MKRSRRDRDAGFALIESIAVLALAALVFLTLLIATDLVSRNAQATARRSDIIEGLMTGLAAVRRDLEGARFIRTGEKPESPVLFSGSAGAVALAVGDDRTDLDHGESLVLFETRVENGRNSLVRSSARLLPGTRGFGSVEFAHPAVVVSGPWQYRFSYADYEAGAERWRSTWTTAKKMPGAVRLEVLDQTGRRVAPPLTVRVAVDSGGCAEATKSNCGREEEDETTEPPVTDQPGTDDGQNPDQ